MFDTASKPAGKLGRKKTPAEARVSVRLRPEIHAIYIEYIFVTPYYKKPVIYRIVSTPTFYTRVPNIHKRKVLLIYLFKALVPYYV